MDPRYFDHAATSPTRNIAIQAMVQCMESFYGNPSSAHNVGRSAQTALSSSKNKMLELLACSDGQLVLCASASEANNLVIQHVLRTQPDKKILYVQDVHPSISEIQQDYPQRFEVIPIQEDGRLLSENLAKHVLKDIALVCVSHICHETGIIHDVAEIAAWCERRGVSCLVDGTQALGHIALRIDDIAADWYTFSAHKFGGPLGCAGVLVKGSALEARIRGGKQEYGMRAGTENIPALTGAIHAFAEALAELPLEIERVIGLKQSLISKLRTALPQVLFPGLESKQQSPFIVSCIIPGIAASALIELLSISGFSVANGSACMAHSAQASKTLLAMGYSQSEALSSLRISFGSGNTEASVEELVSTMVKSVESLFKQTSP